MSLSVVCVCVQLTNTGYEALCSVLLQVPGLDDGAVQDPLAWMDYKVLVFGNLNNMVELAQFVLPLQPGQSVLAKLYYRYPAGDPPDPFVLGYGGCLKD